MEQMISLWSMLEAMSLRKEKKWRKRKWVWHESWKKHIFKSIINTERYEHHFLPVCMDILAYTAGHAMFFHATERQCWRRESSCSSASIVICWTWPSCQSSSSLVQFQFCSLMSFLLNRPGNVVQIQLPAMECASYFPKCNHPYHFASNWLEVTWPYLANEIWRKYY